MSAYTGARPTRAQVLERRTQVVELTRSGLTDDEIAQRLGYVNRSGVWKARQRALEANVADSVDDLRALEVARLDAIQAALWDKTVAGDVAAGRLILRVIVQRVRLLGLDSGKPGGKPDTPTGVVQASFWEHMNAHHPEDWAACRCPGFLGEVREWENGWLR